jgi:hypothetical protein
LKSVYTSDELYGIADFPFDIKFKKVKTVDEWKQAFNWVNLPHGGFVNESGPLSAKKVARDEMDQEIAQVLSKNKLDQSSVERKPDESKPRFIYQKKSIYKEEDSKPYSGEEDNCEEDN